MKKETIDKANELEAKIGYYDKIAFICTFPYQRFKLFRKKAYICKSDEMSNILITDKELAKLIADYCDKKRAELKAELEAL
jgi:hypothetical protein